MDRMVGPGKTPARASRAHADEQAAIRKWAAMGCDGTASMAQVDDAEPIAVRVREHDKICVVRIAVPLDGLGAQLDESCRFGFLLGGVSDMQVEMQSRVVLQRTLAALQGDEGPICAGGRAEYCRPPPETISPHGVTQGGAPELRTSWDIRDTEHDHAKGEHLIILASRAVPRTIGQTLPAGRCDQSAAAARIAGSVR